jgi:hypothetical protein
MNNMMTDSVSLKQLKKEIKDWEYAFQAQQGRKPGKEDILKNKDIGTCN